MAITAQTYADADTSRPRWGPRRIPLAAMDDHGDRPRDQGQRDRARGWSERHDGGRVEADRRAGSLAAAGLVYEVAGRIDVTGAGYFEARDERRE